MIRRLKLLSVLVLLAGLASCYKTGDVTYLDELDVTYTSYDKEINFTPLVKLIVRDSVVLVQNHWDDDEVEEFYKPGGDSEKTIAEIKARFVEIGYVLVDDADQADVAMNVALMSLKTSGTVWYPPYPGWGWGGWPYYGYGGYSSSYWWGYPGWGWGYPWYGYSYSYTTGTLNIEMATVASFKEVQEVLAQSPSEVKQLGENDIPTIDLIWSAAVDGYQGSTKQYNADRLKRGLEEAIAQSDEQIDGFVKK